MDRMHECDMHNWYTSHVVQFLKSLSWPMSVVSEQHHNALGVDCIAGNGRTILL